MCMFLDFESGGIRPRLLSVSCGCQQGNAAAATAVDVTRHLKLRA